MSKGVLLMTRNSGFAVLPLGATTFNVHDVRKVPEQRRMFLPGEETASGPCTEESYRNEIHPVISAPGGQNGAFKRNLAGLGSFELVETFAGDFRFASLCHQAFENWHGN
jgi:hypothetical protein